MAKTKITNAQLWDALRAAFPTFKSHTSKSTSDMFSERGFEKLNSFDNSILNDFWQLSMRVYLQKINVSHTADYLAEKGFGEYYDMPYGGYNQRLAIQSVKPISAKYKGLQNGDSPDPFVVRKAEIAERFFAQNFDYASLVTMPDEFQYKQIFISEYGMDETMSGIMQALENGYINQVTLNKLEALNSGMNSTTAPLKDTQKISITLSDNPTDEEFIDFILAVNNVAEAMSDFTETDAFNAMGFSSKQDKSRLKLLVRPTFKNTLKAKTLAGIYHPDKLNLDVEVITVQNFGGLKPTKADGTALYPVYDTLGQEIGYNTVAGATEVTVENKDVKWVDPNAATVAVLADKGIVFESRQNPYVVEPIRNPRGRYTNYWASSPNNAINYDSLYNLVQFNKA